MLRLRRLALGFPGDFLICFDSAPLRPSAFGMRPRVSAQNCPSKAWGLLWGPRVHLHQIWCNSNHLATKGQLIELRDIPGFSPPPIDVFRNCTEKVIPQFRARHRCNGEISG